MAKVSGFRICERSGPELNRTFKGWYFRSSGFRFDCFLVANRTGWRGELRGTVSKTPEFWRLSFALVAMCFRIVCARRRSSGVMSE